MAVVGTGNDNIRIHRSWTLVAVKRLGARDTLMMKRETSVDLLTANGVKWWTPHDLRRTITMVLDEAGIPGGASVGTCSRGETRRQTGRGRRRVREQRIAQITRLAYGGAQHLNLKRKAMAIWTDAVPGEYVRRNMVFANYFIRIRGNVHRVPILCVGG